MPQTSSVVFEKESGMNLGLFDEERKYGEDIQFFQRFLLLDSYYVIAEKLTQIDIGKHYYGESGLTSNLLMMHKGRNQNLKELYEMGLISFSFMTLMLVLNKIKYARRFIINLYYRKMVNQFMV